MMIFQSRNKVIRKNFGFLLNHGFEEIRANSPDNIGNLIGFKRGEMKVFFFLDPREKHFDVLLDDSAGKRMEDPEGKTLAVLSKNKGLMVEGLDYDNLTNYSKYNFAELVQNNAAFLKRNIDILNL